MNESETRAEYIDPKLQASGWGVVDGSRILREHRLMHEFHLRSDHLTIQQSSNIAIFPST
ncbi:MAG: hypothetical protein WCO78_02725 [Candidatus Roizmanbacteria bacterium]